VTNLFVTKKFEVSSLKSRSRERYFVIVFTHSNLYKNSRVVFAKFYTPIHRMNDMNDNVAGRNGWYTSKYAKYL